MGVRWSKDYQGKFEIVEERFETSVLSESPKTVTTVIVTERNIN